MTSLYKLDYDGSFSMQLLDGADPLKRWFENWRADRTVSFAYETEWLTIEERIVVTVANRKRARYLGEIGAADSDKATRSVVFELGAPAPPSFHRPALRRPPPPEPRPRPARYREDEDTLTIETVWQAARDLGLSPWEMDALASRSRNPWEMLDRLARMRFERARGRDDEARANRAYQWLPRDLSMGVPVRTLPYLWGVDLGRPDPPGPPPLPRYRRNT